MTDIAPYRDDDRRTAARFAFAFAGFAILLVATSTPRTVGDGDEYVGMSMAIIGHGSPASTSEQIDALREQLARRDLRLSPDAVHEGRDGRFYYRHFWLYSALASPFVLVTSVAGLDPLYGFTILNLVLLSVAAGIVAARIGSHFTALLFIGPILWWIDKAHPEAFVFALLAVGFAVCHQRPVLALLSWAVVAVQYPPVAILVPIGGGVAAWRKPELRKETGFLAGIGVVVLVALVHPVYSLWGLGVVSPLVFWGRGPAVPTFAEWWTVYGDLNIGLLVNFPLFIVVAALVAVRLARRRPLELPTTTSLIAIAAALAFPVAFAQTVNVNHGGTPGISRYTLWLIPLAVPLFAAARSALASGRHRNVVHGLIVVSAVWCLVYFHPRRAESYKYPTWIAETVWTKAPRLSNPLPEIFAERLAHSDRGLLLPISTPMCEKVLLIGGRWPPPCAPSSDIPRACVEPDALCYANQRRSPPGAYRFRILSRPAPRPYAENVAIWPTATEERVARLLSELRWWEMADSSARLADSSVLRAAQRVGWTAWWLSDDRFVVFASAPSEGGNLTLRLPQPMTGTIIALGNGATIRQVTSPAGTDTLWNLRIPPVGPPGVAVVLRADEPLDRR